MTVGEAGTVHYSRQRFTRHALRTAILFVGAGLLSRFSLRHFETRWQILIFWALVAGHQLVSRPLRGHRVSLPSLVLDLASVTVAIVAMKVAIEGKL
jgi:hypothetical protein